MKYEITSKKKYHETMVKIYDLMNKGESNLTTRELSKLQAMVEASEDYEDNVLGYRPVKQPQTIAEMVAQKMFENGMSQATLAAKLGLGKSKLSEILNGKRKPDVPFLKALHQKLNIDPAFLLERA